MIKPPMEVALPAFIKPEATLKMSNSEKTFLPNIGLCLIMDFLGMATYLFPGLGETFDIAWAPISAFIFLKMFGGRIGRIGSALNFLEEIIPFTDVIPSFTIAWYIRKREVEKLTLSQKLKY